MLTVRDYQGVETEAERKARKLAKKAEKAAKAAIKTEGGESSSKKKGKALKVREIEVILDALATSTSFLVLLRYSLLLVVCFILSNCIPTAFRASPVMLKREDPSMTAVTRLPPQ
jgi:hypothetical protein